MTAVRRWWSSAAVPVRLRAVVTVVAVAAVLVMAGAAAGLTAPAPALTTALLVALLVLLSEVPVLHVRFGSNNVSLVWAETAVVIALVVLPAEVVVLGFGPLVTLSHLLQRRALIKAVYNGAAATLAAGAAAAVFGLLPDAPAAGHDWWDLALLVLPLLAYDACNTLLSSGAVSVAQGVRLSHVVRHSLPVTCLVAAGNAVAALAVVAVLERASVVLFAVPPLAVVLATSYRAYLHARQERDVWRQLEVASRELNRLEEHEVVRAALHRARELFRSDDVELLLLAAGTRPQRTCVLADGELVVHAHGGPSSPDGVQLELDAQGRPRTVSTTLSAPLETPSGRIGTLRLLFAGEVRLSARERQVLLTFSHSVSTTLQNARLHEDVRAESDRHAHEAAHDPLTGLANRSLLQDRVSTAIAAGDGSTTALLLLDLDHFKQINDTLGHAAGDALLQQVSARLTAAVGDQGLVARLGGDEFAVLLTGLWSPRRAEALAARLLAALALPTEVDGLRLAAEASIGLACHPQDADSTAEIVRRADVAMYQAKRTRGSWLRYDPDRDDTSIARLSLVSELRQALERDEVVVHFQPQLDLRTGTIVSAEALCRWDHPERGLLHPAEFISVVEQSGLVRPFTLRVLELALRACADWNAGGGPRVRVAVNLAARSLLDASLPDDVAVALARTGTRATDLVLEITETTATSELEVVEEVLARLRRSGVEISVDDFGTGYSSLAFLQRSAVNELKVDQGFVRGMLRSDSDAALVRATVQLAHSLGARAVAEGVEDAAHARALRDLGCDLVQGWHYSPAVPAEALAEQLAQQAARLPAQRVVRLRP